MRFGIWRRPTLSSFILLTFSLVGVARSATVTTSVGTSAPTSNIIASQTLGNNELQVRNDTSGNASRDVGQSFQVGSSAITLDDFVLQLGASNTYGTGASGAAFNLYVYSVASASALPGSTGSSLLDTLSGNLPTLSGTLGSDYLTFDLSSSNISLAANGYYAIMVSFPTQAASENFEIELNGSNNAYTGGTLIDSGGGETGFTTVPYDAVFYVTGAAPEPSTAALLGVGGLLVLGWCRRLARFTV